MSSETPESSADRSAADVDEEWCLMFDLMKNVARRHLPAWRRAMEGKNSKHFYLNSWPQGWHPEYNNNPPSVDFDEIWNCQSSFHVYGLYAEALSDLVGQEFQFHHGTGSLNMDETYSPHTLWYDKTSRQELAFIRKEGAKAWRETNKSGGIFGARVKLKSGGPNMTVIRVNEETAECQWFQNGPVNITAKRSALVAAGLWSGP